METNEHYLKLIGKVAIPEPLAIDTNYSLAIQGSITGQDVRTNHNGTQDSIWRFEPVKCEILTPQGKTIKAKDPRKLSQKLRGVIFATNQGEDEELRYERNLKRLIKNWELVENYLNTLDNP